MSIQMHRQRRQPKVVYIENVDDEVDEAEQFVAKPDEDLPKNKLILKLASGI